MFQRLAFLSFLALLIFSYTNVNTVSYSYAAGQYDDKDDDERKNKDALSGIFPRDEYRVELLQDLSQKKEGNFILRIINPGELTGCADLTSSHGKGKTLSDLLKVDVRDSRVIVRKKQPRYSPYDCELKRHSAFVDVQLNRDSLIQAGVKKLSIESQKFGKYQTVDMKITKEKIEIYDTDEIYSMWFYPSNSVILYAQDAPDGLKTVPDSIREFGIQNGLKPMEDVLEGYEPSPYADDFVLFVDDKNFVRNKLKTILDTEMIGTVTGKRQVHGPYGIEDEHFNIHISARIPGEDFDWYKRVYNKPTPKKDATEAK
ncbi:MAG: hypothetical protein OEY94_10175 [Alphaproteobacteria bacterium]|nr:hypothetical protein [Alphaproteobacteria bacterium]